MSTPSTPSPSSPTGSPTAPGQAKAAPCCGHDHATSHGHGHGHTHDHTPGHGHDHAACCGHDHDHTHDHNHGHNHSHGPAGEKEWTRKFLFFLELAVLLIWAVTMVWFYASGRINNYLIGEGTFRIQVLIGGLLLAVLGLFNWQMRGLLAGAGCGHDCGHDHSHDHEPNSAHAHGLAHAHAHAPAHAHAHGESCGHDHPHSHAVTATSTGTASAHAHETLATSAGEGDLLATKTRAPATAAAPATGGDCCQAGTCCAAPLHAHTHEEEGHGSHDHEGTPGGRGLALALLAISVTSAAAFTPDDFSDRYKKNMLSAYSSRKATDQGKAPAEFRLTPEGSPAAAAGMTLAVVEKYRPRNKDGNFELGVEELYYSSADPEYAKVMKGQGVETLGQIVKDTAGAEPGRWRVFILQMTCCAADARPISLPVVFEKEVPNLQEMGWFKLKGTIDYVQERGIPVAILRATDATPSLRPKDQRTLF